jgi:glycerol uptake operon antiterminator
LSKNQTMLGPVIAAVRGFKELDAVIQSDVKTVFLLWGELVGIKDICSAIKSSGKDVFVHVDLIKGLSKDEAAIHYLSREIKPTGVITTHRSVVLAAKKYKLSAIQRFFLIDGTSLEGIYEASQTSRADFIEVMPGVAFKHIKLLASESNIPVIAGGLIEDAEDVQLALDAGCMAVSTSKSDLWSSFTKR